MDETDGGGESDPKSPSTDVKREMREDVPKQAEHPQEYYWSRLRQAVLDHQADLEKSAQPTSSSASTSLREQLAGGVRTVNVETDNLRMGGAYLILLADTEGLSHTGVRRR